MKNEKAFQTITELEKDLAKERNLVAKGKLQDGDFGIKECRYSIKFHCYISSMEVEEYYPELIQRALTDRCFNTLMIIACEQLMAEGYRNNKEVK